MSQKEVEQFVTIQIRKYGLWKDGWHFKWDGSKRRYGQCSHRRKTISLSKHLTPLREDEYVKNTVLHEIAHALTPGHNHDGIWKGKAREIGCNAERCSTDNGNWEVYKNKIQFKWIGTCPECNREIKRHRKTRISCGKCSSTFNVKYLIIWKENGKI